ncbi:MAG: hypothetical protein ACQERC_09080 [Bacteroidota bacterium]
MKTIFVFLSMITFGVLFNACGNDQKDDESKERKVEYTDEADELYHYEAFSLKPFQIDALIYLPDATANIGAATDPKVEHEEDGYQWDLYVGQNFHMHIEDWGEEDALKAHLEELKDQSSIYEVEFLEKEEDFVYYKSTLNMDEGNDEVGVDHVTFHVVAQHTIDGINYIFRTNKEGHPKPITDYMAKSVKSVKPIEDPA